MKKIKELSKVLDLAINIYEKEKKKIVFLWMLVIVLK